MSYKLTCVKNGKWGEKSEKNIWNDKNFIYLCGVINL